MHFATVINRKLSIPLQRQLYEQWREAILTGRFRASERVPSTRELAAALSLSRGTVSEAWDQLMAEGYLETAQGSGTFVCRELPDSLALTRPINAANPSSEPRVKLSRYGARLTEDWERVSGGRAVIRFSPAVPDREHFPFALWRRLMGQQMRKMSPAVFNYVDRSAGDERLRAEIASYVSRLRAVRCVPEEIIIIVNGSQQGLDLSARLLIEPGHVVGFENPGSQGARRVFAACGARLRPLSIDGGGVVVRAIDRKTRLVYVTPSHQYPTGVSMSLVRRLELIEWAKHSRAVCARPEQDRQHAAHFTLDARCFARPVVIPKRSQVMIV